MFVVVEVCDMNPAATLEWRELEKEHPGVSVILHSCLSQCELCANHPYAFVDGEILTADSPEELYQEVCSRVEAAMNRWGGAD